MRLHLHLMGAVALIAEDGRDVTPRGRKARGALALLGTAPGMRLPRARLQDCLWSESPPRQGADSLRQMIHELRSALGRDHAAVMLTSESSLGLDPARVVVHLQPAIGRDGQRAEFAADLDIADPEFEDWLRDMRLSLEDQPPPLPVLALREPVAADEPARILCALALQDAAMRAAEMIPAQLVPAEGRAPSQGPGLLVEARCLNRAGQLLMQMVLSDLGTGCQVAAVRCQLDMNASASALERSTGTLALAIIRAAQTALSGQRLLPLSDLMAFSRDRLLRADGILADPDGPGRGALGPAMRAYLRYTLVIERQTDAPDRVMAEAIGFAAAARAADPSDPYALAVAALVQGWQGNVAGALDLARLACRTAPGHDLAHLVLSQALIDAGRDREALLSVLRGGHGPLAMAAPASWLMRRAVIQLRLGRVAEAEQAAAAAHAHAGDHRPALRMLAALRFHRGDDAGAAQALAQLRRCEPDFSLRLMASPDYPVASLRRAGLLGVTASGL